MTISLAKYLLRMSHRCTPFGLFSGVSIGQFADKTQIVLEQSNYFTRRTRLDFEVLSLIFEHFTNMASVKNEISFIPNTTLYASGNDYRYIEKKGEFNAREYSLKHVTNNESLKELIGFCSKGKTIPQCIFYLCAMGYSENESQNFIDSIIKLQILTPTIEPNVIGEPYAAFFLSQIKSLKIKDFNYKWFEKIIYSVKDLDSNITNQIKSYSEISAELEKNLAKKIKNQIFQIDLYPKFSKHFLARSEKISITRGLDILKRISPAKNHSDLNEFENQFIEKYGGHTTKLIDVLDVDSGLGYPLRSNLNRHWYLSDLNFEKTKTRKTTDVDLEFETVLANKLNLIHKNGVLTITDDDIAHLKPIPWNSPATFYTLVEKTTVDHKSYLYMQYVGGSTAGSLLGRFSGENQEIDGVMKEIATIESDFYSDEICAEISHIPEERTGNILFRSNFRNHIIPFLSGHQEELSNKIGVNDLYIRHNGKRLCLFSKSLEKEIVPFLSNAHNYALSKLPLYRFLCDFQSYRTQRQLYFSWASLEHSRVFLPRVVYKNIILSKARWHFKVIHFKEIIAAQKNWDVVRRKINDFTSQWEIPKYVVMVEGDNTLLLDLQSEISIKILIAKINNSKALVLEEYLQMKDGTISSKDGSSFTNQFVFLFKSNTKLP